MKLHSNFLVASVLTLLFAGLALAGETATLRNGFSIHYMRRQALGEVTRLFLSDSADNFVDVPTEEIQEIEQDSAPAIAPEIAPRTGPHTVDLDQALSAASFRNHLSPDLVRSVVRAESGFNPNARSGKGAQGLMQLMPQTASRLGVKNAMDPVENLEGGTKYLSQLLGRYNNDLPTALAAYNAGPERVEQYHGIPPFPETITYINRILRDLYPQPNPAVRDTRAQSESSHKKSRSASSSATPFVRAGAHIEPTATPETQTNSEATETN